MNKFVEGSYVTAEEANTAVDVLISQGYDKNDITMVSNQSTAGSLSTDVQTKVYGSNSSNDSGDESMMDKIKDAFTGDSGDSGSSSINETSDNENNLLSGYKDDINNGNIVLLVDDNPNVDRTDNFASTTDTTGTTIDNPVVDPINPGSDTVVDSTDDNSVEPALDPTDHAGIDPTEPTHNKNDMNDTDTLNKNDNDFSTSETEKVQLQEEQVDVDTHEVQTGEVKIHKNVTEETKNIEVPVKHEEITIEKHHVTDGTPSEGTISENEEITIPVTEEQIEVTKKPVVTDEVTINKETKEDTKQVSETVRKEDVDIDTAGDIRVEDEDNDGFDRRP